MELKEFCSDWCFVIHSPTKANRIRGAGVITLVKKQDNMNAQPILTAIHSPSMIATMIHMKYSDTKFQKCIVVNYYGAHACKAQCELELVFTLNSLRELHPQADLLLTGDFNTDPESLKAMGTKTNLFVAEPALPESWYTRE